MIYNDSQLFALTRKHYLKNEEVDQEETAKRTPEELTEYLISLGYTRIEG